MPEPSVVSVIMPFLDAERFVAEAIESLLGQSYPHWELLLVDDGSRDRSSGIARSYAAAHPGRIVYLEHPGHRNLGTSAARNLGIRRARGTYLAFLDADDVYLPDRLEHHVRVLDGMPDVDMVQSEALRWFSWSGEDVRDVRGRHPPDLTGKQSPPVMLRRSLQGDPQSGWFPAICAVTLRRSAVVAAGTFEEAFFDLCEDWVFFSKIYLTHTTLATGDVVAKYRKHADSTLHRAHVDRTSFLGRRFDAHVRYLFWLKAYLEAQDADPSLRRLVRRRLWPAHLAPLMRLGLPPAVVLAARTARSRIARFLLPPGAYERLRWFWYGAPERYPSFDLDDAEAVEATGSSAHRR